MAVPPRILENDLCVISVYSILISKVPQCSSSCYHTSCSATPSCLPQNGTLPTVSPLATSLWIPRDGCNGFVVPRKREHQMPPTPPPLFPPSSRCRRYGVSLQRKDAISCHVSGNPASADKSTHTRIPGSRIGHSPPRYDARVPNTQNTSVSLSLNHAQTRGRPRKLRLFKLHMLMPQTSPAATRLMKRTRWQHRCSDSYRQFPAHAVPCPCNSERGVKRSMVCCPPSQRQRRCSISVAT
ncbi:hypothetical protein B0J12DRAFT_53097 [Macrophomina phaseolina]|uniref:Uncharacterized protein n=1 Tax=Macrophomina phaseolina TaxID=35725 RepID=A0ABQ8GF51_9PEZI|nr:hypothetical protein B0J12DRAFT_53097 [Macrophomina phaseolina]